MIDFESDRVSAAVVIPAFNAAATIVETLRALQACPGVAKLGRVFVCDDASKDDTSKLAADAWTAIPQLTILRNEEQLGERRTINAAFERVRGDYQWIFILHADDVVKENWLALYLERIKTAGPRVASICSSYDCWYPEARKIEPGEDDFARDLEVIRGARESVLGTLKAGCWWHIWDVLFVSSGFLRSADFGRICRNWAILNGYCGVSNWAMTSNTFRERLCSIGCTHHPFRQIHSDADRISLSGWSYLEAIARKAT